MSKITLNPVVSIIDTTTAQNTINNNSTTIQTAMDNTLSRDGTTPNQMGATIDMNSNRILNLPAPATSQEPLRLTDLSSFLGSGTVSNIPVGGNTGDALVKNSGTNYDVKWSSDSSELAAGTNIAVTGTSPATVSVINAPSFSGSVSSTGSDANFNAGGNRAIMDIAAGTARIGSVNGGGAATSLALLSAGATILSSTGGVTTVAGNTITAGTGTLTLAGGKTLTNNNNLTLNAVDGKALNLNNTLTLNGTDGTTLTFQGTDTYVSRTSTDTLTNKTLTTPFITGNQTPTGSGALGFNSNQLNYGDGSANHSLVSLDQGQTLTNKTLTNPILSTTAPTANAALGFNTGVSLNWGDGAVNHTAVSTDQTQTLTNKTLTTPVINGISTGTGVSSTAIANTLMIRDGNALTGINNLLSGYTTVTTTAGTTTLTVASTYMQIFTGSSTQTVVLPVTSTLALGLQYFIQNNSTGNVTVQSSGANNIVILPGGTCAEFTCILTSGTTAASWTYTSLHQAGQLLATATNDNANAGNIGEYVESNIASGSAVSLTTATAKTITSISLTAGDWDVYGNDMLSTATTTSVSANYVGLSLTTNTFDTTNGRLTGGLFAAVTPGATSNALGIGIGPLRFSLSATTTIFLVAQASFATSTCSAYGILRARRVR